MEEKKDFKLFREKSLEAVESPESLNDYLRVTSPGVWLALAAVITVLVGFILWSIFGRINTSLNVAVVSGGEDCVCLVPYEQLHQVMARDGITVDVGGIGYALKTGAESQTVIISEETNPYIRVAGDLKVGDVAVEIPMEAGLSEGVYTGSMITESLQPISMLLAQ